MAVKLYSKAVCKLAPFFKIDQNILRYKTGQLTVDLQETKWPEMRL
jgi:hypothetical protein